jgi:hypothetical protein
MRKIYIMKEKERGKCVLFQNQASLKLTTRLLVRNLSLNNKTNCVHIPCL